MTEHSLFPAAIVFNWHSAEAPHKLTIPTREWNSLGGTGAAGGYEAWDSTNRDAVEMATDLATAWADLLPDTSTIDDFVVYTYADEEAPGLPQAGAALGIAGTISDTYIPGTFGTMNFRDTGFNRFKFILIDTVASPGFATQTVGSFTADEITLASELEDDGNAWQSRTGLQIHQMFSIAWTLNAKLQQEYRRRI